MAKGTSLDDVGEAVRAVKLIQEQLAGLVRAVELLSRRVEAIETRLSASGNDV